MWEHNFSKDIHFVRTDDTCCWQNNIWEHIMHIEKTDTNTYIHTYGQGWYVALLGKQYSPNLAQKVYIIGIFSHTKKYPEHEKSEKKVYFASWNKPTENVSLKFLTIKFWYNPWFTISCKCQNRKSYQRASFQAKSHNSTRIFQHSVIFIIVWKKIHFRIKF